MNFKLAKLFDADSNLDQQWFVYYYFKHPETGKMIRFRKFISSRIKTKTGRRDQAHQLVKDINAKLLSGWNPFVESDKSLTTIKEALNFGLQLKYAKCGKRGRWTYASAIRKLVEFLISKKLDKISINEFNYQVAQAYFDHMMIRGKLKPRSINNRINAAKEVFSELRKREFLTHNPFERIEKLRVPEAEITAFRKDELKRIKELLPGYDYNLYVISQLIFYCFLRPAEIVRLKFKDILWDDNIIVVSGKMTKNKKSQVITIPESLKRNLKKWNLNKPGDYYIFSTGLNPGKNEIAPNRIAGAWRKFTKTYNLPEKNIYDLKHTGNGFAFDLGINSRDIQLQNRHSSLDQTQQYLNKFRKTPSEKLKNEFIGY